MRLHQQMIGTGLLTCGKSPSEAEDVDSIFPLAAESLVVLCSSNLVVTTHSLVCPQQMCALQ